MIMDGLQDYQEYCEDTAKLQRDCWQLQVRIEFMS